MTYRLIIPRVSATTQPQVPTIWCFRSNEAVPIVVINELT